MLSTFGTQLRLCLCRMKSQQQEEPTCRLDDNITMPNADAGYGTGSQQWEENVYHCASYVVLFYSQPVNYMYKYNNVFHLNVFFLSSQFMGVAMLIVGGYLQISRSTYIDLMPSDEFFTACALLISSGTIVIVVCLFGFIGLWMRSQCIMLTVSYNNCN